MPQDAAENEPIQPGQPRALMGRVGPQKADGTLRRALGQLQECGDPLDLSDATSMSRARQRKQQVWSVLCVVQCAHHCLLACSP